jgi:hypothetical protein
MTSIKKDQIRRLRQLGECALASKSQSGGEAEFINLFGFGMAH